MKRNLTVLALLWFLTQVTFANANNAQYTDPNKSIVVTKNAAEFSIKLPANPTTGFTWQVKTYDPTLVMPVSQTYLPPNLSRPGAGGQEIIVFRLNSRAF